jgi:hypothetical protein
MARISFVDEITVTQKPEAELPEKAMQGQSLKQRRRL